MIYLSWKTSFEEKTPAAMPMTRASSVDDGRKRTPSRSMHRTAFISYPTILVGVADSHWRRCLIQALREDDYLVLEADGIWGILNVVIQHSRAIHVLLLDVSIGSDEFSKLLKEYRSYMQVVPVEAGVNEESALASARETLAKVKKAVDDAWFEGAVSRSCR